MQCEPIPHLKISSQHQYPGKARDQEKQEDAKNTNPEKKHLHLHLHSVFRHTHVRALGDYWPLCVFLETGHTIHGLHLYVPQRAGGGLHAGEKLKSSASG